jgi:lipopolysaccharide/colanic/teichoic acid biosynthesis glycosyltransferase
MIDTLEDASLLNLVRFVDERAARPFDLDPIGSTHWCHSVFKRAFDMCAAFSALLFFSLPMLLIAACIRAGSKGPAIFIQERIGAGGIPFRLYKFRTMDWRPPFRDVGLTRKGDVRINTVGLILRKLKLDELPQLLNVLRGDMSLVGPRPKLARYADSETKQYRPGLTGAATLIFRDEEDLLCSFADPRELESFYLRHIKPVKAEIDLRYMRTATFASDLRLILATFTTCLGHINTLHVLKPLCEVMAQRMKDGDREPQRELFPHNMKDSTVVFD